MGTLSLLYSVKGLESSYCALLRSISLPSLLFSLGPLHTKWPEHSFSLSLYQYTSLKDMQDKKDKPRGMY